MRSKWKLNYNLGKRRNCMIHDSFLGQEVSVHNGKREQTIFIRDFMIGSYFGEYIITKRLGRLKKKKKNG